MSELTADYTPSDRQLNGREFEMAVNPLVNVLAIGHSFIRRLRDDILSRTYNDLHDNFGLNQCIVHFLHEGTILPDYDNFLYSVNNKIPAIRFHVAVIQIGGNDIDNGCCPLLLASKLQDFANWLKDYHKIQHVYICEIFKRPSPKHCSAGIYEQNRSRCTSYLETLLEECYAKLWRHRRIFNSPNNLFISDGIHLNPRGTKKFYESIKRAIILLAENSIRN